MGLSAPRLFCLIGINENLNLNPGFGKYGAVEPRNYTAAFTTHLTHCQFRHHQAFHSVFPVDYLLIQLRSFALCILA
jgi:hypothetical protein